MNITNVFVLMLENHSYDNIFGWSNFDGHLPDGVTKTTANGLPAGAFTNIDRKGTSYSLTKGAPYSLGFDPGHEFTDTYVQLCGAAAATADDVVHDKIVLNNAIHATLQTDPNKFGFAATYGDIGQNPAPAFSAFTPDQLPVLNFLARQYGVCDNWFSSMPGPTFPNRFFAVAGTSAGLDNSPSDLKVFEAVYTKSAVFDFPNGTVFSALGPADWLVAQGDVAQTRAIAGIHEHMDRFVSHDKLLEQLRGGSLSSKFVFIEPEYDAQNDFRNGNSMHPAGDVRRGEALVKTFYDAISGWKNWSTSLLLIVFDEHGGFFDHVLPGPALPPGAPESAGLKEHNFAFDRFGVRVPAIVVSPYVRAGTIDHTLYDHTSILKTVDTLFEMKGALQFTDRVRAANDFSGILSLAEPRTDLPACPPAVPIGRGELPSSTGSPRAKEPFLALYTHQL